MISEASNKINSESIESGNTWTECVFETTNQFITSEVFKSRNELVNWTREEGRKCGIVVVIRRSDAPGNCRLKRGRITFGCERGGFYQKNSIASECMQKKKLNASLNPQKKKRDRSGGTKRCGCPFRLKGKNVGPEDEWTLEVVNGMHNHHAAKYPEGHSFLGRLTKEENNLLVDMSKNLVNPKEILYTLKQNDPLNSSTMKTIYNARHIQRVVEKAGRSEMQILLNNLQRYNYVEWHRSYDIENIVSDLFWTHPDSVNLLRAFPYVLIMDATYKTNKFRYPLLEIVGVTSTELTFHAAFAYIHAEKEENYVWALSRLKSVMNEDCLPSVIVTDRELALMNAIRRVFPAAQHLLCRWHINRAVLGKCKKLVDNQVKFKKLMQAWNTLVFSDTIPDYERHLHEFERDYKKYDEVLTYVKGTWLNEYKERFVEAWTNNYMHFGTMTSNR
ncbi:protein FAR1-RELATED SEQUENCE 5-like [Rosa chinensis]|uniref:protein FAR1-RELATED SEQUENCE 5-like n=1 Tax=Rosa chinensis TaxID=74649 RepID=UPI000D096502|nr:protein FAR1-RELATED SEQUENCE 5-like [Rosa chinensis]